jgi:thymidylate synthase (FAD)
MPHNPDLEPKPHAFPRLFGQLPLTRFVDYSRSIKVELVKHDDPVSMLDGTFDFVKATWSEDGRESERATEAEKKEALKQMLSGKSLQLGLETVSFIFRISGISRIDTHQIVRQRIGVTFSQQCSGDQWWSHHDALVEPSIFYNSTWECYDSFKENVLNNKLWYQTSIDQGLSIQAARSILPHCLNTFVFMKIDLATLLLFHRKRIDDGSQTWQMNEVAQQMADEVSRVFPELADTFERNKGTFKFQTEASKDRTNTLATGLYLPNPDTFEYHNEDFLYDSVKDQMHLVHEFQVEEFPTEYYWGVNPISEAQYAYIKGIYAGLNMMAEAQHWDNDVVLRRAHEQNAVLMRAVVDFNNTNLK